MHSSNAIRTVLLPILVFTYWTPLVRSQCKVSMKVGFKADSPIFLDNQLNMIYPSNQNPGELQLPWFQDRLVYCPGTEKEVKNTITWLDNPIKLGTAIVPLRSAPNFRIPLVIRCINGETFEVEDGQHQTLQLQELSCTREPDTTAWLSGQACRGGQMVNLGFKLESHITKGVITICYNDIVGTTTWAASTIRGGVAGRQTNGKNGGFSKGILFKGISLDSYYDGCEQVKTFMSIFRDVVFKTDPSDDLRYPDKMTEAERKDFEAKSQVLKEYVQRYIQALADLPPGVKADSMNNFDKGHLVARADMHYAAEQYSTMNYGNAVPMWLSINRFNWKEMETEVRRIAAAKGDLLVVVGGIGVLQLEGRSIYMGRRKGQTERVIPAPKVLFKMVVSNTLNQGIVFVAANNPYMQANEIDQYRLCPEYTRCPPLKFAAPWYGWMYCCTVQHFMANPHVVELGLPITMRPDIAPIYG